ncbi:cytidine deaminase [Ameyamaea chiangmaiensis NBRC 103196]|uniref:Cytidine deaminase n=1 Tax=Ameyamaea chiangmaiensis TaxID=442969 RepID=A0A850P904_9PROT|nr:cytidine deaminase [Ameyamaea chiangmaiensis]MBS4074440.1 cytidine deaminase [Ameyamaea chiangmaiensis]NVN41095.1 cytidine deaminase [Ameyamaea chiangmaiensis]GBQ72047.1 cytidine deaminase [Ameyamaea chiangmaiensis NBRC 103196]
MTDPHLIAEAVRVRAHAYAPYSRFLVGAALRTAEGALFSGCNMENAAYPQGICAEGGALSAMVAAGGRVVTEVVIAGEGTAPCTPCGGCRQKLREFAAPATRISMVDDTGRLLLVRTLAELLPDSFGPENLGV